jgi:CheY-like chemotaxis protein
MDYVLVVDDDPDSRFILKTMIEFQAWPVVEAANGQEAIDTITAQRPAMLFLDLMMPVMDGFSVLNNLQAVHMWRRIPVVVVSAMKRQQIDDYMLPGIQKVLPKSELSVETVREALSLAVMA